MVTVQCAPCGNWTGRSKKKVAVWLVTGFLLAGSIAQPVAGFPSMASATGKPFCEKSASARASLMAWRR